MSDHPFDGSPKSGSAVAPFMIRNHGGSIGQSSPRVDGRVKVRGEATYVAEHHPEGMLYGFPVLTTVPNGRITAIRTEAAEATPGVVTVITHLNAPEQAALPPADAEFFSKLMGPKPLLDTTDIIFHGQYVALVVADTFETARGAAALVEVEIEGSGPIPDFDGSMADAYTSETVNGGLPSDTSEGDVEAALAAAPVVVDATYDTPNEHCNALETHGAVAEWRDGRLLVQDTSQAVMLSQLSLAATMQLKPEAVRVESRFVGGGFGSKFGMRPPVVLAALASKVVGRPVKVALTRQQNFTAYGQRTQTRQRVRLGAERDGRLTAFSHEHWSQTSVVDEFIEQSGSYGRMMYAAPNRLSRHKVAAVHMPTPAYMRAPGESPGSFAVESAMDELAYALGIDPIALRHCNEPETDPENGLPWSSRSLTQCLDQGAERFGWSRRDPVPGRVRDGRWLVGMGVAGASYPGRQLPTSGRVTLRADGTVLAEVAGADIGTGAYTVLGQIVSEATGVNRSKVTVALGDSDLPPSLGAAGSSGTASFGAALAGAAADLQTKLADLARGDADSPLRGVNSDRLVLMDGRIAVEDDLARGEDLTALLARGALDGVTGTFEVKMPEDKPTFSTYSFGTQFAEVGVDVDTGEVRVRRMLGAFGCGRIINPRTAESQGIGGIIMGIGQALMEETILDPRWGQWVNRDLGEYHVPTNADVPSVEVMFVDEVDDVVNALGVKGVGEIPIVGVSAAIANAVFNAIGLRVRDLPITLDKVLHGLPAQALAAE